MRPVVGQIPKHVVHPAPTPIPRVQKHLVLGGDVDDVDVTGKDLAGARPVGMFTPEAVVADA